MLATIQKINHWLTCYVRSPGDDDEIILQKKIWWLINFFGFFLLILAVLLIKVEFSPAINTANLIFLLGILLGPVIFHFYRRGIEWYAFFSQVGIVIICSVKVYLEGGLLYAGAPIFIGLFGPIYALTLPNKKRAIFVLVLYIILMIGSTLMQSKNPDPQWVSYYFIGFLMGVIQIFVTLYYFTTQVDKLKSEEKRRMKELDEFKTKFYTNITHEFRTPLTIILGMADQIKTAPEAWFDEGLSMIKRNGRKLLNLTNQLLDLSKLESNVMPIHWVYGDIAHYLRYLSESFYSFAASKNIQIIFSTNPEIISMDFDPDKIQDIMGNLLSNAIQFTPKGGLIKISLSEVPSENGKNFVLSVRDNGTGIPEDQLPFVFDRYFQAENQREHLVEGAGLGLALTRELIHLLNGTINVQSVRGEGSTFTVQLPITDHAINDHEFLSREKVLSQLPLPMNNDTKGNGKRRNEEKMVLLIVEDNIDVVRYLYALLSEDYWIEVAENGLEGFEKAKDLIPDLVISDVMMPVMDGFEFCKKLKTDLRTSHIPVVMLTARADTSSKIEGLKAGADVYLAKPFNREELFVRIEKLIELRKNIHKRYPSNVIATLALEPDKTGRMKIEDTFIQKVNQILSEHLGDEAFGINELCRSLGMSRSQLYRKFRALTDISVHHFFRKLRLNKALELLHTSDLNITEVALETGFKNLSHFSKVFFEEFGVTPSQVKT